MLYIMLPFISILLYNYDLLHASHTIIQLYYCDLLHVLHNDTIYIYIIIQWIFIFNNNF